MKSEIAYLEQINSPLKIDKFNIPSLSKGQVLVKNIFTSICGTQLEEFVGNRGEDKFLPHTMGHESFAEIIDINKEKSNLKIGDKVVLSWIKNNYYDAGGIKYFKNDNFSINGGPVNTFGTYTVVSENRVYKVENYNSSYEYDPCNCFLGCAIPTGFNAVFESAKVKKNSSILVCGCGQLGVSVLSALSLIENLDISYFDKDQQRISNLEDKKLGKFHNLYAQNDCFDYIFDCTGDIKTIEISHSLLRSFGGKLVIIGNNKPDTFLNLSLWDFINGKEILGAWSNNNSFEKKFQKFLNMYFENNISKFFTYSMYDFKNINTAFDDFLNQRIHRPIIKFD